MNKHTLRSAVLAMALTFGVSATLTIGHSLVAPTAAQAGVIGGLKNAAKAVGGGVKKAAVTVGSAGKRVGNAAVSGVTAIKGGISRVGGLEESGRMGRAGVLAT